MSISGVGEVANLVGGIFNRFFPKEATHAERNALESALISEIENRDTAKSNIIMAEMNQKDKYTKRARPTVVYAGLVFIAINYVIFPMIGRIVAFSIEDAIRAKAMVEMVKPLELPTQFWIAWGGIVSTWSLGRSYEKKHGVDASTNIGKIASLITGNK